MDIRNQVYEVEEFVLGEFAVVGALIFKGGVNYMKLCHSVIEYSVEMFINPFAVASDPAYVSRCQVGSAEVNYTVYCKIMTHMDHRTFVLCAGHLRSLNQPTCKYAFWICYDNYHSEDKTKDNTVFRIPALNYIPNVLPSAIVTVSMGSDHFPKGLPS